MSVGSWCCNTLLDSSVAASAPHTNSRMYHTMHTGRDDALVYDATTNRHPWAPYCNIVDTADDCDACWLASDLFAEADNNCSDCKDAEDHNATDLVESETESQDSDDEEDDGDEDDADDDTKDNDDDNGQCGVASPHTAYAHGYTFIEGFMPADWFDALVRPERRLVLLVCGVPVAVDAAEVERAARVDRLLVTPVGSCRLGPTDAERAHEVDESLYGREGIRRALAPVPLAATLEAVGAPAAEAAGGVGGAVLAGILAALL
ncbi:hypothetical protein pmac_cds_823 [Pandoravirus macleodensis]|uniref:Uncharacterized protein n=1 Tax=Pandoravirus macleodensis TaxID=2107707 RepID=A0A2U7UHT7_9VIRU|nr:hypothetical protein pmac_cds_823 [Pandoravirus macleodensis]AVK77511.1 hypothetical protein pmac_cds_823 [Pandoravirus macleodensis]UMO80313.1 hypothetical protein [Pandoravirus aubagnensis]